VNRSFVVAAVLTAFGATVAIDGAGQDSANGPQFTADGQLMRPSNYREWVYLSSGLGMTYGPLAEGASNGNPMFDNVFVNPAAYKAFLETGTWPDHTMFILEARGSQSKGSINNGGRFQADVGGVESEVKDEKRFPGKWGFFAFGTNGTQARMIPATASCYACHKQNGAVDNTFVQFYPTLIDVAKRKGTFKLASDEKPATSASAASASAPAAETVTDVVCGMTIDPKTAFGKTEYKGKTFYFCQKDCKDAFEKSPEDYAKAAAQ